MRRIINWLKAPGKTRIGDICLDCRFAYQFKVSPRWKFWQGLWCEHDKSWLWLKVNYHCDTFEEEDIPF